MPLLSSTLPQYNGPHAVGTVDLEVPCERRSIANVSLKHTGKPAFVLETVLFSLFYPAERGVVSTKPHHTWLPRPIAHTASGYAKFARVSNTITDGIFTFGLWLLAGGTTIPANVDVPFVGTISDIDGSRKASRQRPHPVIVFSHGMASSRTDYTQYCGELASRGYVVAAIEHRDGSCPASLVMNHPDADQVRYHIGLDDLEDDDGDFDTAKLKQTQLDFRQAEVAETIRVLQQINAGDGADLAAMNPRCEGDTLADWAGLLDMEAITIAGHSYGATLALQTLRGGPTDKMPITGAIILDPGKQSGPLNDDIHVPIMIIHSSSWSSRHSIFFGRPHFDVVRDLVQSVIERGKSAWFMTSMGTSHPSVTDAPLIKPLLLSWTTKSTLDVREAVHEYFSASDNFVTFQRRGEKVGLLDQAVSHLAYNKPLDATKRVLSPEYVKNWQVHVAS